MGCLFSRVSYMNKDVLCIYLGPGQHNDHIRLLRMCPLVM